MKIAIVDDSGFSRNRVKAHLRRILPHASFIECADGEEALQQLPGEKLEFVTLDLVMPKIGGLELLKRFKELEFQPPIVVLSANIQEIMQTECRNRGCYGFVEKPINHEKIASMVKDLGL